MFACAEENMELLNQSITAFRDSRNLPTEVGHHALVASRIDEISLINALLEPTALREVALRLLCDDVRLPLRTF